MIKALSENGDIELELEGTVPEIIADVSTILCGVYNALVKENYLAGAMLESKFRSDEYLDIVFATKEDMNYGGSNLDES